MEIDPGDLLLFARIVECGSFSLAAQRVQLPKSTVSRRISLLEAHLGERLLQRTTRKLVLTEFGAHPARACAPRGRRNRAGRRAGPAPAGRTQRPAAGVDAADFANLAMSTVLARFLDQYPQIALELDLSPRRGGPGGREFRPGHPHGRPAGRLDAGRAPCHLEPDRAVRGAAYTSLRGLPEHPDDLFRHDLLSLPPRLNGLIRWKLLRGKTEWERDLPVRLLANSPELLVRMATTGVGIAASTEMFAKEYLASGELVRVLPEWSFPTVTGWAVFPGRRLMPAKTRVFLDMLQAAFDDGTTQFGV